MQIDTQNQTGSTPQPNAVLAASPQGEPQVASSSTKPEVERVFKLQQKNRWRVAKTSAHDRIEKLKRLRDHILLKQEELKQAIHQDFGKNPIETEITEVFPTVSEINHCIKHLSRWMKPKSVGTPLALTGTSGQLVYEPKGVVLILSPWNYPFNLLVNPLVAAIAAGNTAIIKPSSKVPATSKFLKGFFAEIFEESEVALFEGSSKVSNELLEMPFDHVFFTGSPNIGKTVMAAAAKHLTPVTLELGGKSPVVIDETANLKKAAARVMWGKFINAGQTCVAPDYLLIHESKAQEFVEEAKKVLSKRYGKKEEDRIKSKSFCRLVSEGHQNALSELLDRAVENGAKVAVGGTSDGSQKYLSPTLLTGVELESPIMEEEIFGPILPILTYKNLDQAIAIIQSKPKPLALYIFSQNDENINEIMSNTTAGGTCVNTVILHIANHNLPFGGVGNSGMGSYHGEFGFKTFSHERAVLRQGAPDTLRIFYPPYNGFVKRMVKMLTKYLS